MRKNVFSLTLLIAFLSFAFFIAEASAQPMRGRRMMDHPYFMKDVLNLTPEQEAKLNELRKARREAAEAHMEKMRKMRFEFQELMKDPKADEKKLEGLIDEMSKLRAAHMKSALKHRKEIEKILTPEQVEKLRKFRGCLFERGMMGRDRAFRKGGFFGPGRFHSPMKRFGFRDRMFWDW